MALLLLLLLLLPLLRLWSRRWSALTMMRQSSISDTRFDECNDFVSYRTLPLALGHVLVVVHVEEVEKTHHSITAPVLLVNLRGEAKKSGDLRFRPQRQNHIRLAHTPTIVTIQLGVNVHRPQCEWMLR